MVSETGRDVTCNFTSSRAVNLAINNHSTVIQLLAIVLTKEIRKAIVDSSERNNEAKKKSNINFVVQQEDDQQSLTLKTVKKNGTFEEEEEEEEEAMSMLGARSCSWSKSTLPAGVAACSVVDLDVVDATWISTVNHLVAVTDPLPRSIVSKSFR